MINSCNTRYKIQHFNRLLQQQAGSASVNNTVKYFGVGVGGVTRDTTAGIYAPKLPSERTPTLFHPVPVLMINTSTESSTEVSDEYAGYEEITIGSITYDAYWFKRVETDIVTYYTEDNNGKRVTLADSDYDDVKDVPDENVVFPAMGVIASLTGADILSALAVYVPGVIHVAQNAASEELSPIAVSEIGFYTCDDVDESLIADSAVLMRHDCFEPLSIPTRLATLEYPTELAYMATQLISQ